MINNKKRQGLIFVASLITVFLLFTTPLSKLFFYLKEYGLSTILVLLIGVFLLSCITLIIYLLIEKLRQYFLN